ncbi:hypothetical protein EJ02DRAFT_411776 [Clathrospora elynae]|uniref:Uncharacterized protein n=1 Tax=Clathrospora elynae TaxID=706981 RepID=A0A6A5SDN2_9PLEO|nr:hypothetical protein EJ02DRAFT_411776 [Clathrospora elynae]
MPSLPFNSSATPSPQSSPTLSATPSIVLHPESAGASLKLHKQKADPAEAYRVRYAQYLAATFGFSIQAAMAEADSQLAPRRSSSLSEAESLREI